MIRLGTMVGCTHLGLRSYCHDDWDAICERIRKAVYELEGRLTNGTTLSFLVAEDGETQTLLHEVYESKAGRLVLIHCEDNSPRYKTVELTEDQIFGLQLPPVTD